ncbi:MAG: DNA cytosine methyltransferase [Candidatus Marsarchaeota archaeon]|jgi:DNA (cytosine-5)-methyltransferase 1|nr:DNA cytosine methyltransferase [Candidatus Marsarchaeota archaeon]
MREIIAIDFFCGVGGLTRGLMDAGINVVKGIDIDETVEETYTKNNKGVVFLNEDITGLSVAELMKSIDRRGKALLLAGCAPCQPFSNQNKNKEENDNRKSLIMSFGNFVEKLRPDYIISENVPGFIKDNNKNHSFFVKLLDDLNYVFDEGVKNAKNYGVPQNRSRYVLLASANNTKVSLPEATHGKGKRDLVLVKDTIKRYPKITAGGKSELVPNHESRKLEPINLKRIRLVPHNGGSRSSLPRRLMLNCHKDHNGHSDVYGRMSWNKVAPALTCKCTCLTNGRYGHPTQDRAISLREAAALQTFSDKYIFYGNITDITRHIGNSVPVRMARRLGLSVMEMERDQNSGSESG